jgi:transposase
MTSTTGTIFKTDRLGRVRRTREQKEAVLDEFERSGLSGPKFAALAGVPYQTFATWLQRRKKKSVSMVPKTAAVHWVEAVVESKTAAPAMTVRLPGGATLEISSEAQARLAAQLLRHLAAC